MTGMTVPHLRQKLNILYWRSSSIDSDQALAKALGLSRGNISNWILNKHRPHGNIPNRHVAAVCDLLHVSPESLETKELSDFKRSLKGGLWHEVRARAGAADGLKVVKRSVPASGVRMRGMIYADEKWSPQLPTFSIGDSVSIEFDPTTLPPEIRGLGPRAIVLSEDHEKTVCLCPSSSKFTPDGKLGIQKFRIPKDAAQYLTLVEPPGRHTVLLIAGPPISAGALEPLWDWPVEWVALDRLAEELLAFDDTKWTILASSFHLGYGKAS